MTVQGVIRITWVALAAIPGIFAAEDTQDTAQRESVRVDISSYGNYIPEIEFSKDGKFLCVSWWESGRDGSGPPVRIVLDSNGAVITHAVEDHAILQNKFAAMFPASLPRQSASSVFAEIRKPATGYATFLKNAGGWGFRQDYQVAVRLVKPEVAGEYQPLPTQFKKQVIDGNQRWIAELWKLGPTNERQWAVELPETILSVGWIDFFDRAGRRYIVMARHGTTGYLLAEDDGSVIESFTYGHIETDKEALERKAKYGMGYQDGDPALRFSASEFAFDPARGLLACGAFFDQRVRIISVTPAGSVVCEFNSGQDPDGWRVEAVTFAGQDYLIVKYERGGRSIPSRWLVEIRETKHWKRIWYQQSRNPISVALSPDGKKIAVVRPGRLEMQSFSKNEDVLQFPVGSRHLRMEYSPVTRVFHFCLLMMMFALIVLAVYTWKVSVHGRLRPQSDSES